MGPIFTVDFAATESQFHKTMTSIIAREPDLTLSSIFIVIICSDFSNLYLF